MSSVSERIFPLANLLQLHLSAHGASTVAPISHGVWLGNKFPILWHACLGFEFPHGGTSPLFWLEIMGFLLHCHFPRLQNEGPGAQTHKQAPLPWPCSGIPEWDWGHFLPATTGQKSTPKSVQIGWFHSFGLPITGWGLSVVRRIVGRQRKVPLLWAGNQPAPKQGLLLQVLEVRDHFSCPGVIGLLLWLLSLALAGSDSHRSAQWYDSSQAGLGGWDPQADRNKHCNFLSSVGVEWRQSCSLGLIISFFKQLGHQGRV